MVEGDDGKQPLVTEAVGQLLRIDLTSGARTVVAENLPIGLEAGPGLPPPDLVMGVAAAADGALNASADRSKAIYPVLQQRP